MPVAIEALTRFLRVAPAVHASGQLAVWFRLRKAAGRGGLLMNQAAAASRARDHSRAIRLLDKAVDLFDVIPRSLSRDYWAAELLLRLGDSLRLAGRYHEAGDALARARELAAQDGDPPLRLATIRNAQGILAKDLGCFDEALMHYEAARSVMEAIYGTDSKELAGIHHNLAGLLYAQQRYAEAEPQAQRALALRQRSHAPDLEGLAADLSVLGSIMLAGGRLDEAEQAYFTAKTLWIDRYGPEHYEVAVQLNGMATVLQEKGHFDQAEQSFKEALRIKQQVLGANHRETAALLNNLGALDLDRGHPEAASGFYEKALQIFQSTLGEDHPDTVLCAGNLSHSRRKADPVPGESSPDKSPAVRGHP